VASAPPANATVAMPSSQAGLRHVETPAHSDGRFGGPACRLSRPENKAEWEAYHLIRRDVLLESFENEFHHPDSDEELEPGHHPLLLWVDDCPVGTVRIDCLEGGRAAFRLVAIHSEWQGRGYGLRLLQEAERFASARGCHCAVVYSTPEAAGFYARAGYIEEAWDDSCMGGIVQMRKPL